MQYLEPNEERIAELRRYPYPALDEDICGLILPDGNSNATRLIMHRVRDHARHCYYDRLSICAPWLLSGHFS